MNFPLHRYEMRLLGEGRLRHALRPVEPQPEFRHNWEIDSVDGSLLVCNGKHGKSEGCRYSPFAPNPFAGHTFFEKVTVQRAEEFDEDDYLVFGIEKIIPSEEDVPTLGAAPLYQYPGQMGFMGGWSARNAWRTMWKNVFPQTLWQPQLLVWVAEVKRP